MRGPVLLLLAMLLAVHAAPAGATDPGQGIRLRQVRIQKEMEIIRQQVRLRLERERLERESSAKGSGDPGSRPVEPAGSGVESGSQPGS